METVIKHRPDAPPGFFEAEAAGLRWLRVPGGAAVVEVVDVGPGRIEVERVPDARPTPSAARAFGAGLARTHAAGADAFGAAPADAPLFIGRRPMATAHERSWGAFYARARVLPFVALAVQAGSVDDPTPIEEVCERIAAGEFDDDRPPARIHGDLWSGNVLWGPDGAVLIDPAAHGGHAETDLAMLALFGCPFLSEVIAGYESVSPLRAGWRERIPLHQLHPLAVHAAGYGRAYGSALLQAAHAVAAR